MSDTNNGWPDKPGVPRDPERDGWHWVRRTENNMPFPLQWTNDWTGSRDYCWAIMGSGEPEDVAKNFCYLGPCLTPDEAPALQKRADQSALGYAREARRADLFKFLYKRDVAALQARVAELQAALRDARHDLVAYIENAHPHREKYPHIMKDFENDMEIVRRIDAALEGGKK